MKMGFWQGLFEGLFNFILELLERWKIIPPKKKEPPLIIKQKLINYGTIIKNEFRDVKIVEPGWDEDFIETKAKEPQIKDKKLKLNANSKVRDIISFIDISKCVYPSLSKLLSNEGKVALQLYINYRTSIKNNQEESVNYLNEGLKKLDERYSKIKKWFDKFIELDLNGNLEGIVLPLAREVAKKDIENENKINFTNFIEDLNKKNIFQIGKIKVGLVKIKKIEKSIMNYVPIVASLLGKGCNTIIICGWGRHINSAVDLAEISSRMVKGLRKDIVLSSGYRNIESLVKTKKGAYSQISIYLRKD